MVFEAMYNCKIKIHFAAKDSICIHYSLKGQVQIQSSTFICNFILIIQWVLCVYVVRMVAVQYGMCPPPPFSANLSLPPPIKGTLMFILKTIQHKVFYRMEHEFPCPLKTR